MKLDWISAGRAWPRARPMFRRFASQTSDAPNVGELEAKWKKRWADKSFRSMAVELSQDKKAYILPMFPYPSGNLHMGHLRVYVISDVLARFERMRGRTVIQPMGWDAFGLPAENAAIERGIDPKSWTLDNIARMKEQLGAMCGRWDWNREVTTCDPSYYKHTQRIFLLLYQHGLVYRAKSMVNFDPVDKTVLANEQVDPDGRSWRSGAKVVQKELSQWFVRITAFQDQLLDDLRTLAKNENWPDRVLSQQEHWLGKSEGVQIEFPLVADTPNLGSCSIETFTTRLDTLFGVQYLALSRNHPVVRKLAASSKALQQFLLECEEAPEGSKMGFLLSDLHALNPLHDTEAQTDSVKTPIPVYVTPYVLSSYGTGAVMGVPGHDTRDFAFWQANRPSEPIQTVITSDPDSKPPEPPFTPPGFLSDTCGSLAGLTSTSASEVILTLLQKGGHKAKAASTWRLRDWLISRQRYWGTPIPMIHCENCGIIPVPVSDLPVPLPLSPVFSDSSGASVYCPKCYGPAHRDTDTMDTFMDSSWYQLRFADPYNHSLPFSPAAIEATLPVDLYIGGVEHAILHLLYARFMTKFLSSTAVGLIPPSSPLVAAKGEPFTRLLTQGMVHGKTYTHPETGAALNPESDLEEGSSGQVVKGTELSPKITWEKMSKSKHNGVDPTACIERNGADATRAHILFLAPVAEVLAWDEERIVGVQRWLARVWRTINTIRPSEKTTGYQLPNVEELTETEARLLDVVNRSVSTITEGLGGKKGWPLNTIVSELMILTNVVSDAAKGTNGIESLFEGGDGKAMVGGEVLHHSAQTLLRLMAPITPVLAAECWERLHVPPILTKGGLSGIGNVDDAWPEVWEEKAVARVAVGSKELVKIAIQVNGRLKFVVEVEKPGEAVDTKAWYRDQCWSTAEGVKWLEKMQRGKEREWKRIVVVGNGKVVNFVE
ncbi:MAG: Leucyl-tRNA synthetase, mitochondrial [Vezdaea aestivalis]|nr:MAG: Leucyl-tRNA synthetase, mitochondrial [Vezdaea aestivalis]